jgi:hypothetical protein
MGGSNLQAVDGMALEIRGQGRRIERTLPRNDVKATAGA